MLLTTNKTIGLTFKDHFSLYVDAYFRTKQTDASKACATAYYCAADKNETNRVTSATALLAGLQCENKAEVNLKTVTLTTLLNFHLCACAFD
jgi:hypothetical protein